MKTVVVTVEIFASVENDIDEKKVVVELDRSTTFVMLGDKTLAKAVGYLTLKSENYPYLK